MHFTQTQSRALKIGGVAVGLVAVLASAFFIGGRAVFASTPSTTSGASYTGTYGSVGHASAATSVPKGIAPNLSVLECSLATDINPSAISGCPQLGDDAYSTTSSPQIKGRSRPPAPYSQFNGGSKSYRGTSGAPNTGSSSVTKAGGVLTNFNGVSDDDSFSANAFHVTPPDQALCVGKASALQGAGVPLAVPGNTSVVVEGVNEAWTVYSESGAVLFGPDSLADLFSDPNASGDISCNYDPASQTFFFTEIGVLLSGPDVNNFNTDLAVLNANGYAPYQVDTSVNTTCFPDFPHQGYDNSTFYLTVNQFCGPDEIFAGAMAWAFSKSQLASLSSSVNFVTFGPVALGGDPVLSLQPAFGDTGTEYLVNSFPYDASGNNNSISNQLGLWQVHGDKNITKGSGTVTLSGRIISSETYAFPVPAASTGDGTTPPGAASFVISEPFLNPDDSRMEQVQFVNTPSGPRLYTALNTALTIGSDPSDRDGAAWFVIDPTGQKVVKQGYVAVAGTYLLYPSILRGNTGTVVIDFSMTSPSLNPSTGYAFMKDSAKSFGPVQTTGAGSGPHVSFSDLLFAEPRWGDYSAIALDPNGRDIWSADEYVPPADQGGSDLVDNWGTRVWDVAGAK